MARKKTGKPQGRVSAFSGEKLEWLESFRDEFMAASTGERTPFYNGLVKKWFIRYGYDLATTENIPGSIDEYIPADRKAGLDATQLAAENDWQEEQRVALRNKLTQWFRHRFHGKKIHSGALKTILKTMQSMSGRNARPRVKKALALYSSRYYATRMKAEFDAIWEACKETTKVSDRLMRSQEFVKEKWDAEELEFREALEAEVDAENEAAMAEYKALRVVPEASAESYHEALETMDAVAIPMADALAERLGMHVMILAVGPVGSQRGEVRLRSVFSDTSGGATTKMWPQFEHTAFTAAEAAICRYGRAFFSLAECRARIWPPPEGEVTPANATDIATTPAPMGATSAAATTPGPVPAIGDRGGPTLEVTNNPDEGDGEPTTPPDDGIDRYGGPETLVNLYALMTTKNWGPRWQELRDALLAFETSMYYGHGRRLPPTDSRPAEFPDWMKKHRTGDDFPVSSNFGEQLLRWWRDVGPPDRKGERPEDHPADQEWPLREDPTRADVLWNRMRIAGDSGVMLFVLGLTWWGQDIFSRGSGEGLGGGESALEGNAEWQYMVEDVLWVLREVTEEMGEEQKAEWEAERAEEKKQAAMKAAKERGDVEEEEAVGKGKGKKPKKPKKTAAPKKVAGEGKKPAGKRKRAEEGDADDAPSSKVGRKSRRTGPVEEAVPAEAPPALRPRPKPRPKIKSVVVDGNGASSTASSTSGAVPATTVAGLAADVERTDATPSVASTVAAAAGADAVADPANTNNDAGTSTGGAIGPRRSSPSSAGTLSRTADSLGAEQDPLSFVLDHPFANEEDAPMTEEERMAIEMELDLDPDAEDDEEDD